MIEAAILTTFIIAGWILDRERGDGGRVIPFISDRVLVSAIFGLMSGGSLYLVGDAKLCLMLAGLNMAGFWWAYLRGWGGYFTHPPYFKNLGPRFTPEIKWIDWIIERIDNYVIKAATGMVLRHLDFGWPVLFTIIVTGKFNLWPLVLAAPLGGLFYTLTAYYVLRTSRNIDYIAWAERLRGAWIMLLIALVVVL